VGEGGDLAENGRQISKDIEKNQMYVLVCGRDIQILFVIYGGIIQRINVYVWVYVWACHTMTLIVL